MPNQNIEKTFETLLFLPQGEGRKGEGGLRTQGIFKKSYENQPLISVITVVFNGEKHLEETIQSIVNQTYANMEYIIIDGGSTDKTLEILKKYQDKIDYWVSEKDSGVSDAFNKGVRLSQGKYINFQGDGDGFVSADALTKLFETVHPEKDMFVSAKIRRIDDEGRTLFISKQPRRFATKSLLFRMPMPHQGLFTHIDYFNRYGLFDTNTFFCMDYEHLLRAYKAFPKIVFINQVVANWRADGFGTGRTLEILKEYDKIKRHNRIESGIVLTIVHYWIHFKYYIKKMIGY